MTNKEIQEHIEKNCRNVDGESLMDEQSFYEGAKWMRDQLCSNSNKNESTEVSLTGGELKIPDGYFVYRIEADKNEPYVKICSEDHLDEQVLPIPKSLAYCLSTHDNGSEKMRENLMEQGRREVRGAIREALGL